MPKVANSLRRMSYGGRSPCSSSSRFGAISACTNWRTASRIMSCSSDHSNMSTPEDECRCTDVQGYEGRGDCQVRLGRAAFGARPRVLGHPHDCRRGRTPGPAAVVLVAAARAAVDHGLPSVRLGAARRRGRRPRRRPRSGPTLGVAERARPQLVDDRAGCARRRPRPPASAPGPASGSTGSLTSSTQRPFTKKAKLRLGGQQEVDHPGVDRVTAKRRSGDRRANRRLNSSDSSSMSPRPTRSSAFSTKPFAGDRHLGPGAVDLGHHAREVRVAAVHLRRSRPSSRRSS